MCMSIKSGAVNFWTAFLASIKRLTGWPTLSDETQETSHSDNARSKSSPVVGDMNSTAKSTPCSSTLGIFPTGEILSKSNGYRMRNALYSLSVRETVTTSAWLSDLYSRHLDTVHDSSYLEKRERSSLTSIWKSLPETDGRHSTQHLRNRASDGNHEVRSDKSMRYSENNHTQPHFL